MVKVKINKEKCIGCGVCMALAPEVFEIGEDGKSKVKMEEIPDDLVEKVKEAHDNCPTGAIEIEE